MRLLLFKDIHRTTIKRLLYAWRSLFPIRLAYDD
jgi:hypothetical protein